MRDEGVFEYVRRCDPCVHASVSGGGDDSTCVCCIDFAIIVGGCVVDYIIYQKCLNNHD